MSIPWPRGESWSNRLPEHATQLAKHLQAAARFVHSTPGSTVELDPVKSIIFAALNFVTKVQQAPDLIHVHDAVCAIQAQLRTGAEDSAKELAVIKEGICGLTAEAQKTAIISEEAKAAALEAAAISKATVDIAKDIKNKGIRPREGTPMSYAAAAARGAYSVQMHEQRMPPAAPTQREIIVNIKDSHTIERLRAMNPRTLKTHVNQAITQSENEHITGITIMSANQLKSGDLSIRTTTGKETQLLRQFTDDWVARVGSGSSVRNPTYGVLVHGIRVSTVDMDKQEDMRNAILQDNKPFIPNAEIKYIGWLTRRAPSKAMSSIIVEFTRPEDANKIIDEGLVWQGEMCQSERYERQCRLKQCFKCQAYGHIGTQCKAAKTCGYCALEHDSRDCPSKGDRDAPRKCAACHGAHEAWNRLCPSRKNELAKVRVAYASRPRYHAVAPATGSDTPAAVAGPPLRRTRSTRDMKTTHASARGQKRAAPEGKENEESNQRPQRPPKPSRKALEMIDLDTTTRRSTQNMDLDSDSDQ
ncbi:uncharacterized protein PV09_09336 [Verruconis gallopava]|uniref:CCHC-type domain-containing protein n=1 Tax=Verruconis gallopava TaxID=253628 RepID=A0A0D1YE20_9PEZI|nr:uncharacterized protein PV09_09336 [Verruconis gallopava]KIV98951.1 hypothetical protein PV09_09336 [Verruconis gallopava]